MTEVATVLVVDDEPAVREVLVGLVGKLGLDTREAADGETALEMVAEGKVDLVLLDLNMPRLSGLEFLAALREQSAGPKPAIIVLSAMTDVESRSESIKQGAIDFIEKPFRLPDVRRRIQRALTIGDLERRLEDAEDRLQALRSVDPVTGVGATSQLFRVLEAEFNAARVGERPLTCVVAADESYGRILDGAGRGAAEQRLQALAASIESKLRGADRVFRVDAAEFVVLLPGCARDGAARVVARIREAVAEQGNLDGDQLVVGVATYPHPEISQASLLYRAVNLSVAQARTSEGLCYFEGF